MPSLASLRLKSFLRILSLYSCYIPAHLLDMSDLVHRAPRVQFLQHAVTSYVPSSPLSCRRNLSHSQSVCILIPLSGDSVSHPAQLISACRIVLLHITLWFVYSLVNTVTSYCASSSLRCCINHLKRSCNQMYRMR